MSVTVRKHGSVGTVKIGDREYMVTGYHVQVFVARKHGFSTYRTLPFDGPTTKKVLKLFEEHA
jgi:hypothetical protein